MDFQFNREAIIVFSGGIVGAFLKDILTDGSIELPYISEKKLNLGFIGGWLVGGFAGYFIDGSFITAFMAGYTGSAIIQGIMDGKILPRPLTQIPTIPTQPIDQISITNLITKICQEEEVDPNLALRVAKCESGLRPDAKNVNAPDSIDRGLFQINSKWHPEITDAQAYNPEFSIRFFCQAVKANKLDMWNASKTCWNK